MNRAALPVSLALVALFLAPPAFASEPFLEIIKTQLNVPDEPPLMCTVCHLTLIGGPGTVTKPFGLTIKDKYGLRLQDVQRLRTALMEMETANEDSDGDKVGDIAELRRGTDPNLADGEVAAEEPRYGCYCSIRPSQTAPASGAFWLSALTLSAFCRRAVRRRRIERKP
jgi:hypothetical protein